MSTTHAITVLGHDRPGIVADVTDRLAGLGLNLEDSSMTLLRGHFAMTLVCRGDASTATISAALDLGADLTVAVVPLDEEPTTEPGGTAWVLTVHGGDRPGIVSALAREVARAGGSITDLATRLTGELYLLVAEVDLPPDSDVGGLEVAVGAAADRLGVVASLRPADADEL